MRFCIHFKECVKERGVQEDSILAPKQTEGRVGPGSQGRLVWGPVRGGRSSGLGKFWCRRCAFLPALWPAAPTPGGFPGGPPWPGFLPTLAALSQGSSPCLRGLEVHPQPQGYNLQRAEKVKRAHLPSLFLFLGVALHSGKESSGAVADSFSLRVLF